MPFFSIIIPVYNVAPYLRECLDSVLAQTFTDWEAICVDDGSTDGSGAILDEYAAKDSRFRVFHQSNAGVSAARNRGLDEAKGEWIWFVDSDDKIKPYALERFFGYEPKADIVFFSMELFYADGFAKHYILPKQTCITLDDDSSGKLLGLMCNSLGVDVFGWTWDKFIRSSVIKQGKSRFDTSISYFEDAIFALDYFRYVRSFACMQDIMYSYRFFNIGLTANNRGSADFYAIGKAFSNCIEKACFAGLRKLSAIRALDFLRKALMQHGKSKAASALLRLFRNHGGLLEKKGRFMKTLAMCSRLPDWLGLLTLSICSKSYYYFKGKRYYGNGN